MNLCKTKNNNNKLIVIINRFNKHKLNMKKFLNINKLAPIIIIIFSLIGLYVSFNLTIDSISILKNANKLLPCTVSSAINCLSVMKSKEADVLGFPNSLLGIMGYSMILVTGIVFLTGNIKKKIFLVLAEIGVLGAVVFSYWLLFESVTTIQVLCPLCILSCISATNIFFALTLYNIKENVFSFLKFDWEKSKNDFINTYIILIIIWYVFVIIFIYMQFGGQIINLLNPRLYLPA